jgi:hypothetical protein
VVETSGMCMRKRAVETRVTEMTPGREVERANRYLRDTSKGESVNSKRKQKHGL